MKPRLLQAYMKTAETFAELSSTNGALAELA